MSLCYHIDCNSCDDDDDSADDDVDDDDDDGHLPANTDHWNWIEIGFCKKNSFKDSSEGHPHYENILDKIRKLRFTNIFNIRVSAPHINMLDASNRSIV